MSRRRGRNVAVLCGNSEAWIAVRDAVTAAGDVLVPINPRLAPPEIAYILERARVEAVYADADLAHLLPNGVAWLPAGGVTVERQPRPDELGETLLFTSGTTGHPKGCRRTAAQDLARARELVDTYSMTAADVHVVASPLAYSAPGIFFRAARLAGAANVILPKFRPAAFLEAVQSHRATMFFLVPTQYERLLAMPETQRARYDVSSVRCAIVAGAPIAVQTKRRIIDWLGPGVLWEFYGSSETGTVAVLKPEDQLSRPGSVGTPPAGVEIQLIDGEIFVRSPTVMAGYLHEVADLREGFLSVGDLGRFDDDGYLYLVDRKHDTIISGGMNVYPAEVELALNEHADVRGAVAFGVDDREWGQVVAAVVAGDVTEDQLRSHLRERIAGYKIPKRFVFVSPDELPIGASGKPLRRRARCLVVGTA